MIKISVGKLRKHYFKFIKNKYSSSNKTYEVVSVSPSRRGGYVLVYKQSGSEYTISNDRYVKRKARVYEITVPDNFKVWVY